jgi:2-oxoglutaroyl-CoA hydrolase
MAETLRVERGDIGIATLVIDRQDKHNALTVATGALARELAAAAPLAIAAIKQVLNRAPDCALEVGLEMERKAYAMLRTTRDYEEGIRAFFEERPPVFAGE